MFKSICFDPADMERCSCISDPLIDKDYGPYVVDDSHFVPMSEAVKRVTGGTLSPQEVKSMYDFADGKDTGKKVPIDRSHRVNDLAEISQETRKLESEVKEGLKEAKAQFEYEQTLNDIKGSSSSQSSAE